jgi:hypothetical protein
VPRKRKYPVSLTEDERGTLGGSIARGHAPARHLHLTHARILLKADEGEDAPGEAWSDVKTARSPTHRPLDRLERLEIHYTPKRGSWSNKAEIGLSVLPRQRLERHIPDLEALTGEVGAWEVERNVAESPIDWRFTTAEARIEPKHLYPEIVEEPSGGPNLS